MSRGQINLLDEIIVDNFAGGDDLKIGLIDVDGHNGLEETMDRFTVKARSNCGFVWALRTPGCTVQEAIDRLAAYENTGLEPKEIKKIFKQWRGIAEHARQRNCTRVQGLRLRKDEAGLPPQTEGGQAMPLLNYTTKVDVCTTLGAIQGQLVKHGARKIMQDYDDSGHITALSFMVDTIHGPRGIRLPANVDAVYAVLHRQKVKCGREQAERVAWRIVKDWVEAQMAILESGMVQMDEIFFPYMLNSNGLTAFQAYRKNQLSLPGGTRWTQGG